MGESYYNIHTARTHLHGQDLDSYSPVCFSTIPPLLMSPSGDPASAPDSISQVSSFNLPIQYDSSLVTPVSLTQSHPILAPASLASQKDLDIKLSPSQMSPTYPWLGCDDDYDEVHKPSEMKHKDPPGTRRISTSDSSFPPSPVVCYTPYFGQFGVSATPVSASSSSTSIIPSPRLNAANVLNNGDKHPGRNPSPRMHHGYLGHAPPTVLLSTPDSLALRPSSKESGRDYRQSSLQPASPRSMTHSSSLEPLGPLPSRRKRKPLRETRDGDVVLSGEMTTEEQILMQLTEQQNLPWKEVAARFKEQTGKAMKVPALQMRKKRLVERLRVWTPSEVKYPALLPIPAVRGASNYSEFLTYHRNRRWLWPGKITAVPSGKPLPILCPSTAALRSGPRS